MGCILREGGMEIGHPADNSPVRNLLEEGKLEEVQKEARLRLRRKC